MSEQTDRQAIVSLRDYVDARFTAHEKAVDVAIRVVERATIHRDRYAALVISVCSMLLSMAALILVLLRPAL